jgi:hypothetical protein
MKLKGTEPHGHKTWNFDKEKSPFCPSPGRCNSCYVVPCERTRSQSSVSFVQFQLLFYEVTLVIIITIK